MNEVHNEMKEKKFLVDVKKFLNKFEDVFIDEIGDLLVVSLQKSKARFCTILMTVQWDGKKLEAFFSFVFLDLLC